MLGRRHIADGMQGDVDRSSLSQASLWFGEMEQFGAAAVCEIRYSLSRWPLLGGKVVPVLQDGACQRVKSFLYAKNERFSAFSQTHTARIVSVYLPLPPRHNAA